mgnify:CR=1 FL=1
MFNNKNQKMKNLKTILLGSLVIGSLTACSSDDDNGETPQTADSRTELYATNNSNGDITVYDLENNASSTTITTTSLGAEGIYYDGNGDFLVQASRTPTVQLQTATDISLALTGGSASFSANGQVDLATTSPRDIAVSGNFYVVSDSDNDSFAIYTRDADGSLSLRNTVEVDFDVWGIEFVGTDLYAVVDTTNEVALFSNFLANNTEDVSISATSRVAFEGIVRTHGLAYDGTTMILTDIGAASGEGADTDGGFHVVTNFTSKFNAAASAAGEGVTGTVAVTDQTRISGAATNLGNPVAAEYDAESNTVFIADANNGGGRVLAFASADVVAGGDVAPTVNNSLSAASSLYFYKN